MKLLFITPLFPPQVGGAATYFSLITGELKRRGDVEKIMVFSTYYGGARLLEKEEKMEIWRILPPTLSVGPTLVVKMTRYATFLLSLLVTMIYIAFHKVDVVSSHTIPQYSGGIFAGRLLGVPVVADLQDLGSKPGLFKRSDRLICGSRNTLDYALRSGYPRERIEFIPLPLAPLEKAESGYVKEVKTKYGIDLNKPLICFLGDIVEYKGVYELIEAFKIFKERHPNFSLILMGENREGRKFTNRIRNAEEVIYLGALPRGEALAVVQGSEALVLPSKSEGLPWVCLEAMSLGVKVVCPPKVPEFQEHCPEFVLKDVKPETIAEKMEDVLLIKDVPKYLLERHDAKRVVERLYELYRSMTTPTRG